MNINDIFLKHYNEHNDKRTILDLYSFCLSNVSLYKRVKNNDIYYVFYLKLLYSLKKACVSRNLYNIIKIITNIHCAYNLENIDVSKNVENILKEYLYNFDCKEGEKMFFIKNKIKNSNTGSYLPKNSIKNYANIIDFCNAELSEMKAIKEKNDFIDFVSTIIKRDIKYSYLSETLFKGYNSNQIKHPYPLSGRDENGNVIYKANYNCVKTEMNLTNDDIIVSFNNPKKVRNSLIDIKNNGFIKNYNVSVTYFKNIGIGFIDNGYHHSAIGSVIEDEALVDADVFDDKELLNTIYTNGFNWYLKSNNQKLYFNNGKTAEEIKCNDFRYAVLFTLAQIKISL